MKTALLTSALALAAVAATAQDASAPLPQAGNAWFAQGRDAIAARLAVQANTGTARNVILFVGDGMGIGPNYATRLFMGQQAGGMGDDFRLPFESFPYTALVRTYSTNGQTPDSAPTASALNSGIKTRNDMLNIDGSVALGDCAAGLGHGATTFAEIASSLGKSVGVVTTTRITHATPAAVFSRSAHRDWEDDTGIPEGCAQPDIAAQLIDQMQAGVIDLALGGGRGRFLPATVTDEEGKEGARADGRNLVEEVTAMGGQYAWDQASFDALKPEGGPMLGLFESSHMLYEADRENEPSLAEMTTTALAALKGNEQGFYLMVEGGRIDHALHASNIYRAVSDGAAFAQAVQVAIDATDPAETLIIVTADHDHSVAFNGYCGRGSSVVGLCMDVDVAGEGHTADPVLADDGKPYTVVGFLNGPGSILTAHEDEDQAALDAATEAADAADSGRPVVTEADATAPDYLQQSLIPLESETHSGDDVAAWATGPWAQLVSGSIEQNEIFHVMEYAIGQR